MPIEFRCSQCGRLLRTGDDTAGRQAQCPECGAIGTVPAAESQAHWVAPPAPAATGETFTSGSSTAGGPTAENAYRSPGPGGYGLSPAQRVAGPATALMVTAIIGLCLQTLGVLHALFLFLTRAGQVMIPIHGPNGVLVTITPLTQLASGIFSIAVGIVVLYAF